MWNMIPTQVPCTVGHKEGEKIVCPTKLEVTSLYGKVEVKVLTHPYGMAIDEAIIHAVEKLVVQMLEEQKKTKEPKEKQIEDKSKVIDI